MTKFRRTTLSLAAAQAALLLAPQAFAQATEPTRSETIVVTGRRAAIESAQKIKQESDEIVDSIVAEDIGKLPDNSVTEVLQRVVGVTMDRTQARSDPVHYSVEGSGIVIRGLTYVAAQLNGRETFSANQGRNLGFEDVPPELMTGVDVYKNPSAEQIEGAIAGLVNLRTALPFDHKGFKASVSLTGSYGTLNKTSKPEASALVTNTWDTDLGKFGALLDLAHSESSVQTDTITVDPYYRTTTFWKTEKIDGSDVDFYTANDPARWVPKGMSWRQQQYDRKRDGLYAALQWRHDNVESSLTYFQSKYQFVMTELAINNGVNPYKVALANPVFNDQGVLLKGVLTNTEAGIPGIEMENQTRQLSRRSKTEDLSWNLRWRPSDQWTLTSDLQYVRSRTKGQDFTVGTGVLMPKQTVDLTGSMPRLAFDDSDLAYMADPSHYYWSMTMDHQDRGKGTQKVAKADARFQFHDNPVLTDLRFGLRFADRDATTENSNPSYNWAAVTKAWQQWFLGPDNLAWINNSGQPTTYRTFSNFMGGGSPMPSVYFPALSVVNDYPNAYSALHEKLGPLYRSYCTTHVEDWYQFITSKDGKTPSQNFCDLPWTPNVDTVVSSFYKPSTFGNDLGATNTQRERTLAGYAQLRFGFDDLKFPVDGNVGVRVVHTRDNADGETTLTVKNAPASLTSLVTGPASAETFKNSFTNVLPSLNLRMKARDDLQFRFAWAKAISRPGFSDLQAHQSMDFNTEVDAETGQVKKVTLSGSSDGNPMLKPVRSNQQDATAEWYFSKTGALTVALFNKNFKDVILDQSFQRTLVDDQGRSFTFTMTGKNNAADGHARGVEVGYRQYFDMLPGWLAGFGVDANYTYVDSKLQRYNAVYTEYCTAGNGNDNYNLRINGCDTDGRSFGNMPMPDLSRNTVNLALLYDRGPLSARLAYSWRQRYLQGVALNSDNTGPNQQNGLNTNPDSGDLSFGRANLPIGLPLWGDSYGQLDAGIQYRVNDNLSFSAEAANLTNSAYKQLMEQHVGMMLHNYFTSGRRYKIGMRYTF